MEIVNGLGHRGVRFSKVVSFGNARDVAAAELFEYAATDEQSEIVLAYLEGVPDGQRLLRAMKACASVKPTIVLKGGISESGARAVSSHTASLAGSKEIFEAMCRQAGAMRVETMDELHDLTIAVGTRMRALTGRRSMLIGGGGGFSVLSADAIAREGLDLPELHPETTQRLRELVPIAGNSIRNPIDASFIGEDREGVAREMLDIAATAPGIDMLLVMLHRAPSLIGDERMPSRRMRHDTAGPAPTPEQRARDREERIERSQRGIDEFAELQAESGRPFVVVGWNERRDGELPREILEHAYRQGVAVFSTVPRAARASRLLLEWRARREGLPAIV
jgi:acyl-CoA synthetase (NDP forming)